MATQDMGKVVSLPAGADHSSNQFKLVKLNSSGQVVLAGDGEQAIGILQDKQSTTGSPCNVEIGPARTKVMAGAAGTNGGPFACNASGKAVDAITGEAILGYFTETPGGDGEIVEVLFKSEARLAT